MRSMDDDEDLAVIDQVNRRLALGQLEPSLPWVFVPPGAGLLGYPPSSGEYEEPFVEPAYPSAPTNQPEMVSPSTQHFFPMETVLPMEATCESSQFNSVSLSLERCLITCQFVY